MASPGSNLNGVPGGSGAEGVEKDQKIMLGSRELSVMRDTIGSYSAGESGAELVDVVTHCENQNKEYGLIDDTFLADLRADHTKIQDLMKKMGETRDEVSIVVRTADGSFTRMLLKKNADGHYEEMKKDEDNSRDKTKTHRQDNDLFILEKGVQHAAAA